jgi:hypothetical protein
MLCFYAPGVPARSAGEVTSMKTASVHHCKNAKALGSQVRTLPAGGDGVME